MSIQAVAWVLESSQSRGVDRLVLIALANHANGETGQCWPSQRTIAKEAGVSVGTVPNSVTRLVDLGELEVVETGGARRSARYLLPLASRSGDEQKNAQEMSAARGPGVSAARGPGSRRTIINRHEPSCEFHGQPLPCSTCDVVETPKLKIARGVTA